jgi:hypothetical protein
MEPGDVTREGGQEPPAQPQPDEEPRIIIVDDLPEVRAEEPTFAGMREERGLEDAYHEVVAELRRLYDERYRNPPPADARELFAELDNEVFLPQGQAIGRLIRVIHNNEGCAPDEEEALLRAAAEFLESVK